MNYSTMAMVWAEIVLQKDIDWRTIIGMNKETKMTCHSAVVSTNWCGESDCMSAWLNRNQFECPPWPMRDAEDSDDGDEEPAEDLPPPSPKKHEHREERKDIEYENQMREALRRGVEDQGRPRGCHTSPRL